MRFPLKASQLPASRPGALSTNSDFLKGTDLEKLVSRAQVSLIERVTGGRSVVHLRLQRSNGTRVKENALGLFPSILSL